ncbi:MAG TPA: DEAD/DEAH box helicase [Caldilineales bacterium]|nr:DEAD/DEAH box helicase [Caldilineales bacterium]
MSQTFTDLGLTPELVAGLEAMGLEKPTALQAEIIPHILAGRDILAEAPSGSGRTTGYALPILQTLDVETPGAQVLVLVGGSDNAIRAGSLFQKLNPHKELRVVSLYAGRSLAREAEQLDDTAAIIIGTPPRIREHVNREALSLEHVQFVVIEDIDYLLSRRQQTVIEELFDMMPAGRQTTLFAAKVEEALQDFADEHLFEPVMIQREPVAITVPLINHRYQAVPSGDKEDALIRLLDGENISRSLIFASLRPQAEAIAFDLNTRGYLSAVIHLGMEKSEREAAVMRWQEGVLEFLALTDAAGEDLMLESPYVISYDVAPDIQSYVARSRLVEENGMHFSLVLGRHRALLNEIETQLGQRIRAVLSPTRASVVAQKAEAYKKRIKAIVHREHLEPYMLLLNDLAKEGIDWSEIAAAAVILSQKPQETERVFERQRPQGYDQRRYTGGTSYRPSHSRPQQRERIYEDREVEEGYVRLVMDAGYDIGVRPKDIVGAIANEANVPGRAVGNIDIRDRYTYIEVQEEYVDRILSRVPSTRLRGRTVTFRKV